MGVAWMVLTSTFTLEGFIVGLVVGFAVLLLISGGGETAQPLNPRKIPGQLWALGVYSLILTRDIWLSGVDVAKKALSPRLALRSGIIAVPTQDATKDASIAALSAHAITITPGELVVDFDGAETMYVHCLDCETSARTAPGAQARRLALLKRILGH
jgi:multicomponent Na+:H+ antiporter subunit E